MAEEENAVSKLTKPRQRSRSNTSASVTHRAKRPKSGKKITVNTYNSEESTSA